MVATNDLERLQRLLSDASESLLGHFHGAAGELKQLLHAAAQAADSGHVRLHAAMGHLAGAITAMQFQDVASQLVTQTERRLRNCADRLAAADDEELNAILCCAHSVKGGAATFGFSDVTELTHQMETLLDKLAGTSWWPPRRWWTCCCRPVTR